MNLNRTVIGLALIVLIGGVFLYSLTQGNDYSAVGLSGTVRNSHEIIYSDDKEIALVSIPRIFDDQRELKIVANTISYLYSEGYKYEGRYQTGTMLGTPIDILIFRRGE